MFFPFETSMKYAYLKISNIMFILYKYIVFTTYIINILIAYAHIIFSIIVFILYLYNYILYIYILNMLCSPIYDIYLNIYI
jgi:hypothetical protein